MNNLTIRDAKIIFKNFSGKPGKFTPEGRRSFSVIIEDPDLVQQLIDDTWNVKSLRKRDDSDPDRWQLPVAVNYGPYPPMIYMIAGGNKILLDESTVSQLDWADIIHIDMIIRPREYEIAGRKAVKAYLKTMYVTIQEDELAGDYAYLDHPANEDDIPF